MKKYSKLFVMFLVVLGVMFITSAVNANDSSGDSSNSGSGDSSSGSGGVSAGVQMQQNRDQLRTQMDAERKTFEDGLKTERDTFKSEVDKERSAFKSTTTQEKINFWANAKNMIAQRFAEAISKLQSAQTRVGNAIDQLNTDGKDTTVAKADLDLSVSQLGEANAKLDSIKTLLPATGEKITPDIFAQIKLGARDAKDLLKQSKDNLRLAIEAIKSLRGESVNVNVGNN